MGKSGLWAAALAATTLATATSASATEMLLTLTGTLPHGLAHVTTQFGQQLTSFYGGQGTAFTMIIDIDTGLPGNSTEQSGANGLDKVDHGVAAPQNFIHTIEFKDPFFDSIFSPTSDSTIDTTSGWIELGGDNSPEIAGFIAYGNFGGGRDLLSAPFSINVQNGALSSAFDVFSLAISGQEYVQTTSLNVQHVTLAYIPEPASWALMILGFGGVGSQLRRRGRLTAQRAA